MFDINIHCIVFGVSPTLNKKCILSTHPQDLSFPCMILEDNHLENIDNNIVAYLKKYIFVNDLVLLPQLITINHDTLKEKNNTLNVVYAFIVDYNSSIDNNQVYWIEFDLMKEHKLSRVLFETIQKLS